MSALSPHIRVLRALAIAYHQHADETINRGRQERNGPVRDAMTMHGALLKSMGFVHDHAAEALEAEDAARQPPREGHDQPISINPKGKPPRNVSER